MKIKKLSPQILTLLLVLFATQLSAQDGSANSNVLSDIVLMWALVGVIFLLIIVNFVLSGSIKSLSSDKGLWAVLKQKTNSKVGTVVLALGFVMSSNGAFAQGSNASAFVMGSGLFYALLTMITLLLAVLFFQIRVLKKLLVQLKGDVDVSEEVETDSWVNALTDVIPIEREEEIMFEHEHDGIRELDNNLPPWWLWGFYATIAFALFYVPYYHMGGGDLQTVEYETEMAEAEEAKAIYLASMGNRVDENNAEYLTDETSLAAGREIYVANCVACHGDKGEGGVGPNFADKNWIHGGGIMNVFKTIKYGVPAKGMIPWEDQMGPADIQNVASYILSLEGTNPPNPKEAQGEIWE